MGFANGLKTIVVATDLDGRSDGAMEYARKLAAAYGAKIVLAYCLDPMDYANVDHLPGQVLRRLPDDARAELEKLNAELMRDGIHSHSEMRQGAVSQMLLDVARQHQAGLIMVGTEGSQGAGPVVVGAIAEDLVRQAPCPVMAVASDWNAGPHRPTPGGPILLAMEKNEATGTAVSTACSLAETFQRTLVVLHARTAAEAMGFLNPPATTAADFGICPGASYTVRCVVKDGKPAEAVARAVEQYRPSVLVVGVKRHSETPGPHGTAFSLLAQSRVPVLCVPSVEATVPFDEDLAQATTAG